MDAIGFPETLLEAITYFADPDVAIAFVRDMRWPDGVECPTCGSKDVWYLAAQRRWKCKSNHPKKQFSVKVGTIFEDSPVGLDKWLPAVWLVTGYKNGVSSYEIARDLGVTQKTAWFLMHRVRLAMQAKSFDKLSGEIEADETFIGGKAKNMHKDVRKRRITRKASQDKTIVLGLLERDGQIRAMVAPDRYKETVEKAHPGERGSGFQSLHGRVCRLLERQRGLRSSDHQPRRTVRKWPGSHERNGEFLEPAEAHC